MAQIIFDNIKEKSLIRNILTDQDRISLQRLHGKSFIFYRENNRTLFEAIVNYIDLYKDFPNTDTLYEYLPQETADCLTDCLAVKNDLQTSFLIDELLDLYGVRELRDNSDRIEADLGKRKPKEIISDRLVDLQQLMTLSSGSEIVRKEVWEGARTQWKEYKEIEDSDRKLKGLSWNISLLDKITGGCLGGKDHQLMLFYGLPGTGKSTMAAVNLPFNISVAHDVPVLIISKEMPFLKLCSIFTARMSLLNSELIRDGQLSSKQKDKFKRVLKKQIERKDPIHIVDLVSTKLTLSLIRTELELFKRRYGEYPVYTVVDSLDTTYSGNDDIDGQDYKRKGYCSEVLFDWAKQDNLCIVITDQESRGGAVAKSKGLRRGQESVKGSHGVMPNCTDAFLLDSAEGDEYLSKININCVKARYGEARSGSLFYIKEYAYIGEKIVE